MKLFDTAHIVKKITVETELGEWREPHGVTNSVVHMDGKTPGVVHHARLGASGLQLIRGTVAVCLPLDLLFELAAEVDSKFTAAPDKVLPAEDLEQLLESK